MERTSMSAQNKDGKVIMVLTVCHPIVNDYLHMADPQTSFLICIVIMKTYLYILRVFKVIMYALIHSRNESTDFSF